MKGRFAWGMLVGTLAFAAAVAAAPTAAMADDATCGSKQNPCPLQKWMRQSMAAANSSGDMAALATAFDKLAGMSPDKGWNGSDPKKSWDAIAKAGAAAAKANDAAAVKAACKSCHDAFKDEYKTKYRTKPLT